MGILQIGRFIREINLCMDDLGVPPFQETSISELSFFGSTIHGSFNTLHVSCSGSKCTNNIQIYILQHPSTYSCSSSKTILPQHSPTFPNNITNISHIIPQESNKNSMSFPDPPKKKKHPQNSMRLLSPNENSHPTKHVPLIPENPCTHQEQQGFFTVLIAGPG